MTNPPAKTTVTGRVARKRLEARTRIVEAAARLFRDHGVDAVTIEDITTAADVGHGSFYLHFKSKHEVLLPIMLAAAAELDARVQRHLDGCPDPAEILATSARYIGGAVVRDPLWRWFLTRAGVANRSMRLAFGRFNERDLRAGMSSGRFAVDDPKATATFCFGGYVSVLLAGMEVDDPQPMIDGATETILRVLGLDTRDAADIAHRPIDTIDEHP